ncbi:Transcriptional regulator [Amycolatopsis camponoti]|uniref:Transcriptional regulator n=1 Tax=Amycolatopsis camponoti TaxID=2606593 RepID=A0A6I8LKU8_9PSEU|nr:TetR family transcriptional regulator [Amycolatopsis camponoti]VVJ17660.1 Transcriptional regulator [Amycolatopsis camponoti]
MTRLPEGDERRPGARELARRAMRAQVSEMALDLFLDRGYEQTTIDDICAVAGISRSTFFRYFPSKEDVFASETSNAVDEIARALRQRPDDESPWSALRHAMGPLVEHYASQTERAHRLAALAVATPALAALNQEKHAKFRALIAPELARRLGSDPDDPADPRPRALIAGALGCLEAAVAAWIAGDGKQQLGRLLDRAMDSISS